MRRTSFKTRSIRKLSLGLAILRPWTNRNAWVDSYLTGISIYWEFSVRRNTCESMDIVLKGDTEMILTGEFRDIAEVDFPLEKFYFWEDSFVSPAAAHFYSFFFISSVPFHMAFLRSFTVLCAPFPILRLTKMAAPSQTYCSQRLSHPVSRKSRASFPSWKGCLARFLDFFIFLCHRKKEFSIQVHFLL